MVLTLLPKKYTWNSSSWLSNGLNSNREIVSKGRCSIEAQDDARSCRRCFFHKLGRLKNQHCRDIVGVSFKVLKAASRFLLLLCFLLLFFFLLACWIRSALILRSSLVRLDKRDTGADEGDGSGSSSSGESMCKGNMKPVSTSYSTLCFL